MKLQVTQENLNRALGTVARVANARNPLPVLANVLLRIDNNRLSLSATNLDIAITQFVGAKISEEGSITVPARLMQDFIGSLPEGVIELTLEDTKLHITTERYNSVINGIVADDFPVMPSITAGNTWSVSAATFKKASGKATRSHCIPASPTRRAPSLSACVSTHPTTTGEACSTRAAGSGSFS